MTIKSGIEHRAVEAVHSELTEVGVCRAEVCVGDVLKDYRPEERAGHHPIEPESAIAASFSQRHGKLKSFSAKVILMTDSHCASACQDFADLVRLVPGAIYVGKTTSVDSVYIDIGWVDMPSDAGLIMPLKVWRNRLRGNNEPLLPDVSFDCDMDDDTCVQTKTLAVLGHPSKQDREVIFGVEIQKTAYPKFT